MSTEQPRLRGRGQTLTGPGKRTVYVTPGDAEVWDQAAQFAAARNVSLSSVIAVALGRYIAEQGKEDRA